MPRQFLAVLSVVAFMISMVSATPRFASAEPMTAIPNNHVVDAQQALSEVAASPDIRLKQLEIQFKPDKSLYEPNKGRALATGEFSKFYPSAEKRHEVVMWLEQDGFTILEESPDYIKFSGIVRDAERAFGVDVRVSKDGTYVANIDDPRVPTRFASLILSILGLNTYSGGAGPMPMPGSRVPSRSIDILNRLGVSHASPVSGRLVRRRLHDLDGVGDAQIRIRRADGGDPGQSSSVYDPSLACAFR
jgi:subtilase family serine protease